MGLIPRLSTPAAMPEPPSGTGPKRDNLRGAIWLIVDMSFNIWSLTLIKIVGADLPAVQIVFMRALVGLGLMLPFVWRNGGLPSFLRPDLQILRAALSAVSMVGSYHAISVLSLGLFTAVNFTKPLLMMVFSALLLGERILRRQWAAGVLGLVGVIVVVQPGSVAFNAGLISLFLSILAGTGAVVILRHLRAEHPLAMMLSFTSGMVALSILPALWFWQPPGQAWPALLAIGVISQIAQFCFMRAHYWGDAGVLAPLGYSALILSVTVGYLVFDERPTLSLLLGAGLIVAAALIAGRTGKRSAKA